jgi:hypothetical protein
MECQPPMTDVSPPRLTETPWSVNVPVRGEVGTLREHAPVQLRTTELVHGLVSTLPRGASVDNLLQVAGTLDDEAADEMTAAIEEGCERVETLRPRRRP